MKAKWAGFFLFVCLSVVFGIASSTSLTSFRLAPAGAGAETPLYFVPNQGQTAPEVLFYARTEGLTAWLTGTGMVIERLNPAGGTGSKHAVCELKFVGTRSAVRTAALDETEHRVSYFYGREESEWRTDIPTFKGVLYRDLYDGIDLKVYGRDGRVEFDWVVRPGADPSRIGFAVVADEGAVLAADGGLSIGGPRSGLRVLAPEGYQVRDGLKAPVASSFRETGGVFGFTVGAYDPASVLVIDPIVLAFGSYLGGRGEDKGLAVAVDAAGAVYVLGLTKSMDFPPVTVSRPREDVFVSKIAPDGRSLVYSAFFPSEADQARLSMRAIDGNGFSLPPGFAVDGKGAVYLTGVALNRSFPLKNPYQDEFKGRADAFFLKLAPSGKSLVFSSFLGGGALDAGMAVATDGAGAVYVCGVTESRDFPVANAFQKRRPGAYDVFVAKFTPDGQELTFSTYLGSPHIDVPTALAVDGQGVVTVAGFAGAGFPLKKPVQRTFGGGVCDAFVSKLSALGNSLVYSSYLGGPEDDRAQALALDAEGAAYVAGYTLGSFPLKNAFQKARKGSWEGFVAKIVPEGPALAYSTYLGGRGIDWPSGIAVDGEGAAYVFGTTSGTGLPLKDPYQNEPRGRRDSFLTVFAPNGKSLILSTFLGGKYEELRGGIALGPDGGIHLAGMTNSPDFPLQKAFQRTLAGEYDAYVLKLKKVK